LSAPRPILLTGANGQLGWELHRALQPLGEVVALNRAALDLAQPDQIRARIRELRPSLVVNPAAFTAVDRAETETGLARAVNAEAPGIMAEACRAIGAALLHYSTDYVFDGSGSTPWSEGDAPDPVNTYGATKLAGERAIAEVDCEHLIVRTSWVYSLRGANFLTTMARLAQTRETLRIVDDQFGAPTSASFLADLSAQLVSRWRGTGGSAGVLHACSSGETSWFGFACAMLETLHRAAPERASFRVPRLPELVPIRTRDYPTPARRPSNSRLCLQRLEHDWGLRAPDWAAALALVLREA